jgi:hypothetical protein
MSYYSAYIILKNTLDAKRRTLHFNDCVEILTTTGYELLSKHVTTVIFSTLQTADYGYVEENDFVFHEVESLFTIIDADIHRRIVDYNLGVLHMQDQVQKLGTEALGFSAMLATFVNSKSFFLRKSSMLDFKALDKCLKSEVSTTRAALEYRNLFLAHLCTTNIGIIAECNDGTPVFIFYEFGDNERTRYYSLKIMQDLLDGKLPRVHKTQQKKCDALEFVISNIEYKYAKDVVLRIFKDCNFQHKTDGLHCLINLKMTDFEKVAAQQDLLAAFDRHCRYVT